jgi:flagellar L-ring protein precursor FlgH
MNLYFFKNFFRFLLIFSFCSCSSYVSKMHQSLDDQQKIGFQRNPDKFSFYRNNLSLNQSEVNSANSRQVKKISPSTKRQYNSTAQVKSRKNPFNQNDENEGSIWNDREKDNFLFSRNYLKKIGDIVQIKINEQLRNEITLELSRAFPDLKTTKSQKNNGENNKDTKNVENKTEEKSSTDKEKNQNQSNSEQPGSETDSASTQSSQIADSISSLVVEEFGPEHILLRGKKEVLYKKRKRMIELEVLVSRSSVDETDSVTSDQSLEHNIIVYK